LFETGQRPPPEPVELVAQCAHACLVEPVDATGALGSVTHHADVLEHLEVLRHRRLADRQGLRQLTDGALSPGELDDDRAARSISQCRPSLVMFVSHGE